MFLKMHIKKHGSFLMKFSRRIMKFKCEYAYNIPALRLHGCLQCLAYGLDGLFHLNTAYSKAFRSTIFWSRKKIV